MFRKYVFPIFLFSFLFSTSAFCEVTPTLSGGKMWPFSSTASTQVDETLDILFQANGNTIFVIDSQSLEITSQTDLDGSYDGVQYMAYDPANRRLYAACGWGGIQVFGLDDATGTLSWISTYKNTENEEDDETTETDIYAAAVFLYEGYLFVSDFYYGLRIINTEDPQNLSQTASYKQLGIGESTTSGGYFNAYVTKIDGTTYAFVLDRYHGIRVFDFDPENLPENGVIEEPFTSYATYYYFGYMPLSNLSDIHVSGNYIYVTDKDYLETNDPKEFGFSELKFDPSATGEGEDRIIGKTGRCSVPEKATSIDISGSYAYLADSRNGVYIVDISDQGNLSDEDAVNNLNEGLSFAYSIKFSENYAYVTDNKNGLSKIKIPADPAAELSIEKSVIKPADADSLCIYNGYVYMVTDTPTDASKGIKDGLRIINPSGDTGSVSIEGFLPTGGTALDAAVYKNVSDSRIYAMVADGSNGIVVADVTDPASPQASGGAPLSGANTVEVSNNILYSTNGTGLSIFDLTDPGTPLLKGAYNTPGTALDVFIENGQNAFVADGENGLILIDVTDPEKPSRLAAITFTDPVPTNSVAVHVSGSYAYIADENYGLRIVEIVNNGGVYSLVESGRIAVSGKPEDVSVSGKYAFVATESGYIYMIDTTDKNNPVDAGEQETTGITKKLLIQETTNSEGETTVTVIVADGPGGLRSYSFYEDDGSGGEIPPFNPDNNGSSCFIKSASIPSFVSRISNYVKDLLS